MRDNWRLLAEMFLALIRHVPLRVSYVPVFFLRIFLPVSVSGLDQDYCHMKIGDADQTSAVSSAVFCPYRKKS
jgi:hypothetical protein